MTEPTPRTERMPVRIKVYGGGRSLLTPGTDWRVARVTEHVVPGGLIGEVMPEWSIIDLQPAEVVEPAEGDVQRRCWTIFGPDPIGQCSLFNGHDGPHQ
jgi:hypothetical protein